MTDYREVLRLRSLGFNNSQIATSMGLSRPTVIGIVQRSMSQGLDWQTAEGLSDRELSEKIFPSESEKPGYKMPDYDWVHREMAKPGVTLQLLWFEYSDRCREAGEIFCSQFDVGGWHTKLGDPVLADAICDRIVHDSYSIVIGGVDSMRKRKGITEEG